MIKKILKIHHKSFNDYDSSEFEFKKINLIYGLNGKGKSTFVQFLREKIDSQDLSIFEASQTKYKIFIYDELYKRNILYINDDDKEKSFRSFYAGEYIKDIIDSKNIILEKINKAMDCQELKEKDNEQENSNKNELKSTIAKKTREILEKIDGQKYKTPQSYTKSFIKDEYFNENVLSNEEFIRLQEQTMDNIPNPIGMFSFGKIKQLSKGIESLKQYLEKTPENQAIEKFKQDSELENFAKMAIKLKDKYPQEYNEKCPLCEQSIMQIRLWENLEKHFNQEYKEFIGKLNEAQSFFQDAKDELEKFQEWLNKNLIKDRIILDENVSIDILRQKYLDLLKNINENMGYVFKALEEKIKAPNKNDILLEIDEKFLEILEQLQSNEIESIITNHNEKQKNYRKMIESNIEKIKKHLTAERKDDFFKIQDKIRKNDRYIKGIKRYIACCENKIKDLDEKLKQADESFKELNKDLQDWFFKDIRFEKISDSHYKIQRKDCNDEWIDCKSGLSEGEKTIVSVIYFINFYKSTLNNLQECPIVLIDDPITSLDYQNKDKIVNYIKEKIILNSRGQIFILSHDKSVLAKFDKDLNGSSKKSIFEIKKSQLASFLEKIDKIKLEKDLREKYERLKRYIESPNGYLERDIKELPREILEGLFSLTFGEKYENFINRYNKLLEILSIGQKYTASDIHKLKHNKNDEEVEPEVLEKCKFVVEIFEKFMRIEH